MNATFCSRPARERLLQVVAWSFNCLCLLAAMFVGTYQNNGWLLLVCFFDVEAIRILKATGFSQMPTHGEENSELATSRLVLPEPISRLLAVTSAYWTGFKPTGNSTCWL